MLDSLTDQFAEASRRYADMYGIERDRDWYILKLQEEMGELTQAWNRLTGRGRAKGLSESDLQRTIADETADLLGHVLLLAREHAIDLDAAIERKWKFRPAARPSP